MAEFTLRSDQIDVEQIMRQIRARIKEKRGADYTEEEIRELASVKLERFLDPRALRADLVQHYRRQRPPQPFGAPAFAPLPPIDNYAFDADTIYASHRGPLKWVRKLLNPLLKLFFNPNPLIHVLHLQGRANVQFVEQFDRVHQHFDAVAAALDRRFVARDELDGLNYEVLNNLVLELTRLGIENRNLKMRVESLSTRLDFDERRARALEGVVQYRPGAMPAPPVEGTPAEEAAEIGEGATETDAAGRPGKRRRRRRGRRRGPGEEAGGGSEAGGQDEAGDRGPREADPAEAGSPDPAPSAGEGGDSDPQ